jgi:hypothetical protein
MIFFPISLALFIGLVYAAYKLTNRLYLKFYRMADQRGRASQFESIVRRNNYTQPRDLEFAYQEAISDTKAA